MKRSLGIVSIVLGLAAALIMGCGGGAATGGGGDGSGAAATTTSNDGGGGSATGTTSAGTGGAGQGGTGTGGTTSTTSATGGSGGTGTGSTTGSGTVTGTGLATLGALVVLGDSISDGGGQSPFYYDLLRVDLTTKYGAIAYQNKANSGSKTGNLTSQIGNLPNTLPGPVAVVITSGGNDMKAALPFILTGTDAAAKAQMGANIQAALDALLVPNRFGPGVAVHVYEGNVYDASDGAGDYGFYGCAFGQGLPAIPTDGFFAAWNGVIHDQIVAHGQTEADMHMYFYGHGYKSVPNWYAPDCTHPSQIGHSELRKLFYHAITGESLP